MDDDFAQIIAELQTVQLSLHEIRVHAEAMMARCEALKARIEALSRRATWTSTSATLVVESGQIWTLDFSGKPMIIAGCK